MHWGAGLARGKGGYRGDEDQERFNCLQLGIRMRVTNCRQFLGYHGRLSTLRFDSRSQVGCLANLSACVAAWLSSKINNQKSSIINQFSA